MAKRLELYKCEKCGIIVEVLHGAAGVLVCCEQGMKLCVENTTEAAREKHVPLVEKVEGGYKVAVGSVAHPMEEKHFIEWIELAAGDTVLLHFLQPGETPEATFQTDAAEVTARAYCNLHGFWKS